jgi:MOSC domain-containing protein YiiM
VIASNLWTSPAKGSGRMDAQRRVRAVEDVGFDGCAHARAGTKRQVLFASAKHLAGLDVERGRIRENITVEGADVHEWPVGQHVRIGEAEFEITMECEPCERMDAIRPGLREQIEGKRGMLARVVRGGELAAGDEIQLL